MDLLLPTELWLQIFGLACTDTGATARSISKTCRYFYEVSKPIKLHSVVIQGALPGIAFLQMIEAMPQEDRVVHNMYLSLYDPTQIPEDQFETESEAFRKQCQGPAPLRDSHLDPLTLPDSPSEELTYYLVEQRMCLVIRILEAVAPTLKFLTLLFTEFERSTIFLPLSLPCLRELVLYGDYSEDVLASNSVIALPSLRRLRLSDVYYQDLSAISALAPNLTHLRLDHKSGYSVELVAALEERLQTNPSESSSRNPPNGLTPFPGSLEKFILCSKPSSQYMCGHGWRYAMLAQKAMDDFVKREPKVVLCKELAGKSLFSHVESLAEWLERVNGQSAYWEETRPVKAD